MKTNHRDLTLINKGAISVQPSNLTIQRVSINHRVQNGFRIKLLSRLNVVIDQQQPGVSTIKMPWQTI